MSDEEYERAWKHVLRDLNEAWEEIKRLKAELAARRTTPPATRELVTRWRDEIGNHDALRTGASSFPVDMSMARRFVAEWPE